MNDEQSAILLVRQARAGNAAAFAALLQPYLPTLLGLAITILRHSHAAEDAVQEACLRAYLTLGTLRDDAAFGAWLRRIVANRCIDALRSDQRAATLPLDAALHLATPGRGPDTMALSNDDQYRLRLALNALPDDLRIAVELHALHEYRYSDIAQMLGIPEGTVKSRIHTGRQRLRQAMAADDDAQEAAL